LAHVFKTPDDAELEQQIYTAMHTMMAGQALETFDARFQSELVRAVLSNPQIGDSDDWIDMPDLCFFVQTYVLEAAVRVVLGPHMLALNPTFVDDFWNFNSSVRSLAMGIPAWLNRTAVKARERMHQNVKRWERYAVEHCNIDDIPDDVQWEPFYGLRYTRVRQTILDKRGITDESARAAEMLSYVFA
jgi:hypothetical protein